MILDVRTMGLISAIMPFVLGFVMVVYWWERRTYGGFAHWILANFAFGLGYLLVSMRGIAPDILSIILGNAASVYAEILIYQGIRLFYGQPAFSRLNIFIFSFHILLHSYFTYISPDINARIVLISFAVSILIIRSGMLLINCPITDIKRSTRNAGYIFLITAALPITRAVYALQQTQPIDLFTDVLSSWYSLLAMASIIAWTFYFFLINSARLEMDLEAARMELMEIASTDSLSGLYNRRHFFEHAEIEFHRAQRHECDVSFLLLDVDNFKLINDNYGHDAGDVVMKFLATILKEEVRAFDLVARYGGDEFIIMLVNANQGQAYSIAERIRSAVAKTPVTVDSRTLNIHLSGGISSFDAKDPELKVILKRADDALYRAKRQGRNRVEIA